MVQRAGKTKTAPRNSGKNRISKKAAENDRATKKSAQSKALKEPKPPFPKQHQESPGSNRSSSRSRATRPSTTAPPASSRARSRSSPAATRASAARSRCCSRAKAPTSRSTTCRRSSPTREETSARSRARRPPLPAAARRPRPTRAFCDELVERTVKELGKLDILVSNAAHQNRKDDARRAHRRGVRAHVQDQRLRVLPARARRAART